MTKKVINNKALFNIDSLSGSPILLGGNLGQDISKSLGQIWNFLHRLMLLKTRSLELQSESGVSFSVILIDAQFPDMHLSDDSYLHSSPLAWGIDMSLVHEGSFVASLCDYFFYLRTYGQVNAYSSYILTWLSDMLEKGRLSHLEVGALCVEAILSDNKDIEEKKQKVFKHYVVQRFEKLLQRPEFYWE